MQPSLVVKSLDSGPWSFGFKASLYHLLALQTWSSYLVCALFSYLQNGII